MRAVSLKECIMQAHAQLPLSSSENTHLPLNPPEFPQPIYKIRRHARRQLPFPPLLEHLTHKNHIRRPLPHQTHPRLPPRQPPRQHRPVLHIHHLALPNLHLSLIIPRIKRPEHIPHPTHPQFQRLHAAGLQFTQVEGAGCDAVFDGDAVVEVYDGVDGAEGRAGFE